MAAPVGNGTPVDADDEGQGVKVFVVFLLASFILGGRALGRERPDRPWLIIGACLLVSAALFTYRFA